MVNAINWRKKIVLFQKILLILLIFLSFGCGKKSVDKKDEVPKNSNEINITKEGIISDKYYDGIEIKNIKFVCKDNITSVEYDLINTLDKGIDLNNYKIYIKDDEYNILYVYDYSFKTILNKNSANSVEISIDKCLENAFDMSFEFNIE